MIYIGVSLDKTCVNQKLQVKVRIKNEKCESR